MSIRVARWLLVSCVALGLQLAGAAAADEGEAEAAEEAAIAAPEAAEDVTPRSGRKGKAPLNKARDDGTPGGGDEGPSRPPRRRPSSESGDDSTPESDANVAARQRLRRQSDDASADAPQNLALPRPPRVRRAFASVDEAVADSSPAYRNLYNRLLRSGEFQVELIDDDGTGGSYEPATNRIRLARRALDGNEIVDNLLFESFNARNRQRFDQNLGRLRRGEIDLTTFGEQRADIELDTVVRYVREINRMLRDDPDAEAALPARAQRARALVNRELGGADVVEGYPDAVPADSLAALRRLNRSTPHDPNATSGRYTLPTAELYRYERVASLQPSGMISMLLTAVQYQASSDEGRARSEIARASRTNRTRNRPAASIYLDILDATEETFTDEADRRALERYRFSPEMRRIAEEEAAAAENR